MRSFDEKIDLLCLEWAEDLIKLEDKVVKAEKYGWERYGPVFQQEHSYSGVSEGDYVQRLIKRNYFKVKE